MAAKIAAVLALTLALATTGAAQSGGPLARSTFTPVPVTGDSQPFGAAVGLPAHYVEDEFIASGLAHVYAHDASGQIVVQAADLPYSARVLVRKPRDPRRFNGTVVFELFNATTGFDTDVVWLYARDRLVRDGYIWVGLSNTFEGNAFSKNWNPARYAALGVVTFGQTWDMAAQVALGLKDEVLAGNPLAGYDVRTILAAGHSASARFWRTYGMVNQAHAVTPDGEPAIDGYLLSGHRVAPIPLNNQEPSYTDDRRLVLVDVPAIRLQTETEVSPAPFVPQPSVAVLRQPDSDVFRMYEVAGTSHADQEFVDLAFGPGSALGRDVPGFPNPPCVNPPNRLAFSPYVRMSLHHLERWVNDGVAPPPGRSIDYTSEPPPGGGSLRDVHGNATGGIRPPQLEAPRAQHLPYNPPAVFDPATVFFCSLSGSEIAFDQATLDVLYPTRGHYVRAFVRAAWDSARDGYLLPDDAARLVVEAVRTVAGR